jgi:hypothetical protein
MRGADGSLSPRSSEGVGTVKGMCDGEDARLVSIERRRVRDGAVRHAARQEVRVVTPLLGNRAYK